jgi:hypothetical protein
VRAPLRGGWTGGGAAEKERIARKCRPRAATNPTATVTVREKTSTHLPISLSLSLSFFSVEALIPAARESVPYHSSLPMPPKPPPRPPPPPPPPPPPRPPSSPPPPSSSSSSSSSILAYRRFVMGHSAVARSYIRIPSTPAATRSGLPNIRALYFSSPARALIGVISGG